MNYLYLRKKNILLLALIFTALLSIAFVSRTSISSAQAITTIGTKTLLVIRVDFSDRPGEPLGAGNIPFTFQRAQDLYAEVNQFFVANSYGKTSVSATVIPVVVRLPQRLDFYVEQHRQTGTLDAMVNDARIEARKAGYEPFSFDFDVVAFTAVDLARREIAVSKIGERGSALSGAALRLRDAAHELGHNYGLEHANAWDSHDNNSPIGAGVSYEYEDMFDMMGYYGTANTHFNAVYKHRLGWLPAANTQTVSDSRSFDIYPIDAPAGAGQTQAVKVPRVNDDKTYWIEYRPSLGGALIHWDYDGTLPAKTQLLDMTPATSDFSDAALLPGAGTFLDDANGISVTVTGRTAETLQVRVETGLAPRNCTYSLSPDSAFVTHFNSTQLSTRVTTNSNLCHWTATSDAFWLKVITTDRYFGSKDLVVATDPNSGVQRVGTIRLGNGQTFTVTQASGSCRDSITPNIFNVPQAGGSIVFSHTCLSLEGQADGTAPWINLGTNPITVSANPNQGERSGVISFRVQDSNGSTSTVTVQVQQAGQNTTTPTPTPTPTPIPTVTPPPTPTPVITPTPTPTPIVTPTPTPVITPTPVEPTPTPKIRKRTRIF